jgi:hypothetical protein
MADGLWQVTEPGSGSRSQRSEVGDERSSRILKFSIRKLSNPQSAIGYHTMRHLLFAHVRSSLSVLDFPQHLLFEALADGVDQNFLADAFDKLLKLGFG